jgi:hypothetical protein
MASEALRPSPEATAAAASGEKGPAKTDNRRNVALSVGGRRL